MSRPGPAGTTPRATAHEARSQITVLILIGLALYAAGALLQHIWAGPHAPAITLRLVALAVLAFAAMRHRTL
ncbi:MAG TPA: hypothetical protein VJS11_09785, partial [Acidobacteriaceae bacterium]|nr:hypothetical protein [Acidobacteriaceae bacterium]